MRSAIYVGVVTVLAFLLWSTCLCPSSPLVKKVVVFDGNVCVLTADDRPGLLFGRQLDFLEKGMSALRRFEVTDTIISACRSEVGSTLSVVTEIERGQFALVMLDLVTGRQTRRRILSVKPESIEFANGEYFLVRVASTRRSAFGGVSASTFSLNSLGHRPPFLEKEVIRSREVITISSTPHMATAVVEDRSEIRSICLGPGRSYVHPITSDVRSSLFLDEARLATAYFDLSAQKTQLVLKHLNTSGRDLQREVDGLIEQLDYDPATNSIWFTYGWNAAGWDGIGRWDLGDDSIWLSNRDLRTGRMCGG